MPLPDRDALPWEAQVLPTARGDVRVRLYLPADAGSVVIMVGGVGGGFDTPARDLYPRLSEDLADAGIGTLRVRFRDPRSLDDATSDLVEGLTSLSSLGVGRLAVVGHSFGGAVALRAAAVVPAVVGVVTLATQAYGTDDVEKLDRPVLLVHGDADEVLPWQASADVARRAGPRADLHVLAGSGHDLLEHRRQVRELVAAWLRAHLSVA